MSRTNRRVISPGCQSDRTFTWQSLRYPFGGSSQLEPSLASPKGFFAVFSYGEFSIEATITRSTSDSIPRCPRFGLLLDPKPPPLPLAACPHATAPCAGSLVLGFVENSPRGAAAEASRSVAATLDVAPGEDAGDVIQHVGR